MISIVTPSFRQLKWLRLCIASVADQKDVDVEHIVQDGGTDQISENELQPDPPSGRYALRLFVEKDQGMYDAINRGLRRAKGEICAYLNCDEQYLPGTLTKVAEFFRTHPNVDVLFGDVILVDEDGQPLSYRRTILPSLTHVRLAHLNTTSCAMFFRRRLLDCGFYFDPRWKAVGDAAWVVALLQAKVRMQTLWEPLAIFTFTGENLGATPVSAAEGESLREGARFTTVRTAAAVLAHRIRKGLAGAYRRRRVEIEAYTLDSPDKRQRRTSDGVGSNWPST